MKKTSKLTVGLFGIALIVLLALPGCKSDDGGGTIPTITTAELPNGTVGVAYNQTLEATGDKPITWSVSGGTLPDGLTLAANGEMSGTPTEEDTFTFTVRAANAAGSKTKTLSITIDPAGGGGDGIAPTIIADYFLPHGVEGKAYDHTLVATGDAPITWSITGGILPPGLILEPTTGAITGTPTMVNRYTIFVKAENAAGEDNKELLIIINAAGGSGTAPTITTASLPNGTVGVAYNHTLTADGDAPIRWYFLSGPWPTGLILGNPSTGEATGEITGTPTVATTYTFTLKAENAAGEDTKEYTVTIAPPSDNEVAGKSLKVADSYKTEFYANLEFEVFTWEPDQVTWVGGDWGHYSKGTYTYDSTEKTVALTVTHIWREDDNEVSRWMAKFEAPEAEIFFTFQVYQYEITTDGSLLAQRIMTNTGNDELAGQTYSAGTRNYVFAASGNTYSRSGTPQTTGTYYFDSEPKTVCLRPTSIGGKTMAEYYDAYDVGDYWGDIYTEDADIKAAVTNQFFGSVGFTYNPDTKMLSTNFSF
jgi:hypothetical protein